MKASGPQISYLKTLIRQCFSRLIETGLDEHHMDRITMKDASRHISELKQKLESHRLQAKG